MPTTLEAGCEVSSYSSRFAPLMPLEPGAKKRKRGRMSGIILKSAPEGKWVVLWATGDEEVLSPRGLSFEGDPNVETMIVVREQERNKRLPMGLLSQSENSSGMRVSETETETVQEENGTVLITNASSTTENTNPPSTSTAIVPLPPLPPTEETAIEAVGHTQDLEEGDEQEEEDERIPTGSGYVYDDEVLNELLSDRFGTRRAEVERKKVELLGTSVHVGGRAWVVIKDIKETDIDYTDEEFSETGLRSENYLDLQCFPKRLCSRMECEAGRRASPRITRQELKERDEGKAMLSYFQCLYPVVWKQSLKKLNDSIDQKNNTLLAHQRKCPFVSEYEYWSFIGLLLLASVQKQVVWMESSKQRKRRAL